MYVDSLSSSRRAKKVIVVCDMLVKYEQHNLNPMHAHGNVWEMSESASVSCLQKNDFVFFDCL